MSIFRRRSYTEAVEGRRRFLARAKLFVLVFLAFELVSGLLLSSLSMSSRSMTPSLVPGELLLATPLPFGPETLFGKLPAPSKPERGDLVLVRPPFEKRAGGLVVFANSLVRFASFQKLSLLDKGSEAAVEGPFVERVIALPGDLVSMEDFVFKVKPADSAHALTEFEFSSKRYDIHRPTLPEGWTKDMPLSGTMAPRLLSHNEYFVALDERASTADSRSWGPIGVEGFKARVLLRYWPLARFGGL